MADIPYEVRNLPQRELLDMAYTQLGRRLHPGTTPEQILDLLRYKPLEEPLLENPIDAMRTEIMSFIERHKNQLSLACHEDCFAHCDGLVIQCYIQLQRDTDIHVSAEDLVPITSGGRSSNADAQ